MSDLVIYDACVLYPSPLRDLLIRFAIAELVRARWSERILDEVFRNVARNRPDLDPARLRRTREMMCAAVLDAVVQGFEAKEASLTLPDPDDRHVLAAALHSGARVIVTFNLRDFPAEVLAAHGVVAIHPDAFASGLLAKEQSIVLDVLREQAASLKSPPASPKELLATLERCGLPRFGTAVRAVGETSSPPVSR